MPMSLELTLPPWLTGAAKQSAGGRPDMTVAHKLQCDGNKSSSCSFSLSRQ